VRVVFRRYSCSNAKVQQEIVISDNLYNVAILCVRDDADSQCESLEKFHEDLPVEVDSGCSIAHS